MITNVAIDLDGDSARVQASMLVAIADSSGDAETLLLMGGIYRFDTLRTADGWRISALQVTPVWSGKS